MQNNHCYYMGLALEEAKKGVGRTSPNPAVGALIVKDGVIVGKGYHKKAGTPHAEIHALRDAGLRAQGATLYVTLEPCNHTGKTPPCTEAVLRAGIAQVIIGMPDPNPKVVGGGAEYLKSQGIVVCSGILEHQCRAMNNPFIKHSKTGLPWVIMKAGLSLDGKITFHSRQGAALTGPESLRAVHHLRNQVDAILIGVETAIIDDPSLTTRLENVEETRDPLRIVLDSGLRLPEKARMLHQVSIAETWIICGELASREKEARLLTSGAKVFRLPTDHHGRIDLSALLRFLGNNNITSLLVEGGGRIHGAMYQQHVDEICLFYAPYIIGDQGTPLVSDFCLNSRAEAPGLSDISVQTLGNDVLFRALVQR